MKRNVNVDVDEMECLISASFILSGALFVAVAVIEFVGL